MVPGAQHPSPQALLKLAGNRGNLRKMPGGGGASGMSVCGVPSPYSMRIFALLSVSEDSGCDDH